ncbi:hypothetical protein AB0B28_17420 [Glycomyces sp. NPDC046736]|uniref:hypothetical protein n=1 Tax=Glycomyces sp. NPDC046736 TaxID=3155615 RepID=UPI0033C9F798
MSLSTAGRPTPLIGALAASLLALSACGGEPEDEAKDSESDAPSTEAAAEAAVDGFPVGEPFGEAVWSVDVGDGEATVTVRPDRVVVDRVHLDMKRTIQAYTPEGAEAWTFEFSDHEYPEHIPVAVLDETVAVLADREVEASGLDSARTVTELTLLSLDDGSVVAEVEFPDGAMINNFGNVVFHGDDGFGFATEDGQTTEVQADTFGIEAAGHAGGTPFWLDRSYLLNTEAGGTTEVPGIERSDIANMEVLAVDGRQGLLAIEVTHGPGAELAYFAVEVATGEVLYELSCPGFSHTQSESNMARTSPNGEYVVHESIWMSKAAGQCFGGDDGQRTVELVAVDDQGNAYGSVDGGASGELVTIPAAGEPEVSTLPSGAPVPSGIMNGGIAVHFSGTTLTGNPIQ